jgi:hypothetical protein
MRIPNALLLPLLAPLAGCFVARNTVNEPIERAAVGELVPGTSTAADATALLGAPSEVVQLGYRTAYRYDFLTTKRAGITLLIVTFFNDDTHADRVWLFFDKDDVLTHLGATIEADEAAYAMPWQKIHGEDR